MNKDSCAYVIYVIHAYADKWNMLPSEVYRKLNESGCIENFLVPHYDILHTQGTEYVLEDIREYLEARGIVA